MKKLLAIVLAALMIAACSVTAFAETTNVSYNVDPSYTVSIPAAVTLGDSAVEADITASDVIMEDGKQIKVELTSASNTASGSTFNAKNGDSTVTYTITGDEAIAVGDTVATFTANGSKTLTFSAADKSAATVAGTHTETLTFGIAVEDAVSTPTLADAFVNGSTTTIIIPTFTGNNTITFTNNNGTYNIGSKSLNPDAYLDSVSVTPDGDKLVIRVYSSHDADSFSVTLDKSDNSYSVWDSGYYEVSRVTSLVINETEIIDTVSKK